jgi:Asp-tRNA(Asn)/Glu-tRNA(Gln) amidotransferase A subunit family amidase
VNAAGDPLNAAITWLDEPLRSTDDGPLAGKTLLVKDLIDTEGIRTTYGSRVYADHVPPRHATVVARVLAAGAAVVGKANLAEFAWGVLGTNDWYGTVHNPVRPGLTTGGSSSGNAAAISARTPAARSGCPRRPARSSGSRPGTGPSRSTASSRSVRPSTPSAPSGDP